MHLANGNSLGMRCKLMYSKVSARVKLSFVKPRREFAERVTDVMRKLFFCTLRKMATFEQVLFYGKTKYLMVCLQFERQFNNGNNFGNVMGRMVIQTLGDCDKNTASC